MKAPQVLVSVPHLVLIELSITGDVCLQIVITVRSDTQNEFSVIGDTTGVLVKPTVTLHDRHMAAVFIQPEVLAVKASEGKVLVAPMAGRFGSR